MDNYKNYQEVFDYVNGVISGEIIANKYRIKACERFLRDLKNTAYDFEPSQAEFVIGKVELDGIGIIETSFVQYDEVIYADLLFLKYQFNYQTIILIINT